MDTVWILLRYGNFIMTHTVHVYAYPLESIAGQKFSYKNFIWQFMGAITILRHAN